MFALDHRLLRQFLAIAETGTVRGAAAVLNMSQPPLTATIQQLEERLGVRLFERSVKGMLLTEAGCVLAQEARLLLGRLEHVEAHVKAVGGRPRQLRIGFVSAALDGFLPELVRKLLSTGEPPPELVELTTPEQLEHLERGKLDIGLLHPPVEVPADIEIRLLDRDPFWAALPSAHSLARRRAIRFAEIAAEPFVLFPKEQGPFLYGRIREKIFAESGRFTPVAHAKRVHSQLSIISSGLGVGLVTRSTAEHLSFKGVRMRPFEDPDDSLSLELAIVAERRVMRAIAHLSRFAEKRRIRSMGAP